MVLMGWCFIVGGCFGLFFFCRGREVLHTSWGVWYRFFLVLGSSGWCFPCLILNIRLVFVQQSSFGKKQVIPPV